MSKETRLQSALFALAALFSATNLTATEQPQNGAPAASEIPTAVEQISSVPHQQEADKPSTVKRFSKAVFCTPWLYSAVIAAVYVRFFCEKWGGKWLAKMIVKGLEFIWEEETIDEHEGALFFCIVGLIWIGATLVLVLLCTILQEVYYLVTSKKEAKKQE